MLRLHNSFPADATELRLTTASAARALIFARRPEVLALLRERRVMLLAQPDGAQLSTLIDRVDDALLLSLARLALRHGSWGEDFHQYHNENHALEIVDGRIGRLLAFHGLHALSAHDWLALSLFSTCHDLRQREQVDFSHPVGNNEAASIAETERILDCCGFDRVSERPLYVALELMIAGSTFDPRPAPPPSEYNPAEFVATGGALAPKLASYLDRERPGWRNDADIVRGVALAHIASDLDTANVAEPFPWFAESASRLCQEREMRCGRTLDSIDSGRPCLGFLSDGQERYFFDLHQFCSTMGQAAFADAKDANAGRLRRVSTLMRERCVDPDQSTGAQVMHTFADVALSR